MIPIPPKIYCRMVFLKLAIHLFLNNPLVCTELTCLLIISLFSIMMQVHTFNYCSLILSYSFLAQVNTNC